MKLRPLVVIPFLLAGAVGANAQTIKPGLWEVTNIKACITKDMIERNAARGSLLS
jgi:hypothetical protein